MLITIVFGDRPDACASLSFSYTPVREIEAQKWVDEGLFHPRFPWLKAASFFVAQAA